MATRRKFTLEFRIEAAHRVIDSGRSVTEVARVIRPGFSGDSSASLHHAALT
ncbi:MAG: transposase [Acidobacteria bacterium]|nr:transposase [Acidobacteriota bacterium]